jgi:hypothetical protein
LWLPEMIYRALREGGDRVAVVPGRRPVLMARQLATLAGLTPAGCCRCSA